MDPLAERDVAGGVRAVDVEGVGLGEDIGLAVGGGEVEQDPRPRGEVVAGERRVAGRDPPPRDLARLEAQDLLDGVGDQRRIGDELGPGVAARQQAGEAVADQVGDRLVAGERQAVDDRLDLVVGDVVGMGVVGVEQLGGEVVGAVVALVGRELAAVAPVAEHPLGDLDLLGARGVAPRERLAVAAPVLEQVVVLLGEPDEPEHRLSGQRVRQRGDELGRRTGVEHGVDQLVGAPDDERLERLQPPPREALPRVHPDPRVVGLGEVGHHGDGIEVGDGEDRGGLRGQRVHRILDVDRGVDVGVHEHLDDVLHPRHHDVAELVGVEDRRLLAQLTGDGVRVGEVVGAERVPRPHRAPRRRRRRLVAHAVVGVGGHRVLAPCPSSSR